MIDESAPFHTAEGFAMCMQQCVSVHIDWSACGVMMSVGMSGGFFFFITVYIYPAL